MVQQLQRIMQGKKATFDADIELSSYLIMLGIHYKCVSVRRGRCGVTL